MLPQEVILYPKCSLFNFVAPESCFYLQVSLKLAAVEKLFWRMRPVTSGELWRSCSQLVQGCCARALSPEQPLPRAGQDSHLKLNRLLYTQINGLTPLTRHQYNIAYPNPGAKARTQKMGQRNNTVLNCLFVLSVNLGLFIFS